MATILIPLPDADFDVTEVAVPWQLFSNAGHRVLFATEHGAQASCDPLLLRGVLFGQLGASAEAKAYYARMQHSREYGVPIRWQDLDMAQFDALLLPGGHAQGKRQYLGDWPCLTLGSRPHQTTRNGLIGAIAMSLNSAVFSPPERTRRAASKLPPCRASPP